LGKLRKLSGKEICRIRVEHGFERIRQRGSHVVMQKPGNPAVTVPVPPHKIVKTGTLMSIIRQSGIDRKVFEAQ